MTPADLERLCRLILQLRLMRNYAARVRARIQLSGLANRPGAAPSIPRLERRSRAGGRN
jgi:hypothetical protein